MGNKINLEYEENDDGYKLNIEGTSDKSKGEKISPKKVIDHQIRIISKILFKLMEQKEAIDSQKDGETQ